MTPDWAASATAVPYADFGNPQSLNLYTYVKNNPTSGADADGHCCDPADILDAIDFASGVANAWASDNLLGAFRQDSGDAAYHVGQAVGDAVATVQGAAEVITGGGGEVGGLALDATGVGALAGVPVGVVSAGVIAHGAATASEGFIHLAKAAGQGPRADAAAGQTSSGQATDQYGHKLGPSGEPMVNKVDHPTVKSARDAARAEGKRAPVKHASPAKGKPHFHATDESGKKLPCSTHHNCPE